MHLVESFLYSQYNDVQKSFNQEFAISPCEGKLIL
jgi:hypothetical protein